MDHVSTADHQYFTMTGRRYFYRICPDAGGNWYWEPRPPTEAERQDIRRYGELIWEAAELEGSEMPPVQQRGPYRSPGAACVAAESWFDRT